MDDIKSQYPSLGGTNFPVYPKSFVSTGKFSKERDRVFVIMPFEAPHSDDLWQFIGNVCGIHRLKPRRGDSPGLSKPVMADILEEIEKAEIVIADLTGLNPNVLYETGIAHVRCDSVILIAQAGEKLPFDLASIRCIFFDLRSIEGREAFRDRLSRAFEALRRVGHPIIIDTPLQRTELVVNDLHELLRLRDDDLVNQIVRTSSSLSAYAIGPEEAFLPEEKLYHNALLQERQALVDLASRGCLIKCIITPPFRKTLTGDRPTHLLERLTHLLAFLESRDPALRFIQWAVSPFRQKNLYIIGHISYIEGFKAGPTERGFPLSLRQTGRGALDPSILIYDELFKRMATYTVETYGEERTATPSLDDLRQATTKSVKLALKSW